MRRAGLCLGDLTWAGSQDRAQAGSKEGAHCLLVPADGVPSSCVTAFRHCVSPPGLPLSAQAQSLSFGLRIKLLIFPLSIQSGLRPQELIPRGLAGTSYVRPTARALQLHFWETVHHRGHTGQVCQWALASWWPAVWSMVRAPAGMHTCWS